MPPADFDLATVVPHWRLADLTGLSVYALILIRFGIELRRLLGWSTGIRAERLAIDILFGVLVCGLFYAGFIATSLHPPYRYVVLGIFYSAMASFVIKIVRDIFREANRRKMRSRPRPSEILGRLRLHSTPKEWLGYAMIAALAMYYVVRTAPLFEFDGHRLRLWGAAYSDKMTNMMPAAALVHSFPPDCLRFTGYKFPSHCFPHLMAAMSDEFVGVRYFDAFWFHLPVLGIAINGLAILAFGRRVLKSYAAGCVGLMIYGLMSVTAYMKPLELTPALALVALMSLDRYARSKRRRWAVAAVLFIGVMPAFEAFRAAALLAGLIVWGVCGLAIDLLRRRRPRLNRLVIPTAATLASLGVVQLLYLGERPVNPTRIVADNTFADSYRHEWLGRAEVDDPLGRTMNTLYAWNRNQAVNEMKPSFFARVVGRVVFNVGLPIYVFLRFIHLGLFGLMKLAKDRRRGWKTSEGVIAATACFCFALPWVIDVGLTANGQWWSSPNLYRLPEFAAWLTATLGAATLVNTVKSWRRPRAWAPLAVAIASVWAVAHEHEAATTYYDVSPDRLATLSFLQRRVPYEDTVLHPWADCSIRIAADGREAFVYKRHFTLASNLAGRRCYYEGREDYLFWNGFVAPDEIYRRSRLRRKFYEEPTDEELRELLDGGRVKWIVVDESHPAPPSITANWSVVFNDGGTKILHRP